jgi:hypothetical protein
MRVEGVVFKRWVMRCIAVPKAALKAHAQQTHVPVLVALGGESWDSTLAPHDERHWLLVIPSAVLKAAGRAVGDTVSIDLAFDPQRAAPALPPDFERALSARPGLLKKFREQTVAYQRQIVRYIDRGKSPDTREKYIETFIERLNERSAKQRAARAAATRKR